MKKDYTGAILLGIALLVLVTGLWVNISWLYSKENCALFTYHGGIVKYFSSFLMFWNNYCVSPEPTIFIL